MLLVTLALAPARVWAQTCHVFIGVDDGDEMLAGVTVTIRDSAGRVVVSGTTDGTGMVRLDVAPGWYRAYASAPGLGPTINSATVIKAVDGDVAVGLSLTRFVETVTDEAASAPAPASEMGEIRGRVLTTDGLPVDGARVEATGHRVGTIPDRRP